MIAGLLGAARRIPADPGGRQVALGAALGNAHSVAILGGAPAGAAAACAPAPPRWRLCRRGQADPRVRRRCRRGAGAAAGPCRRLRPADARGPAGTSSSPHSTRKAERGRGRAPVEELVEPGDFRRVAARAWALPAGAVVASGKRAGGGARHRAGTDRSHPDGPLPASFGIDAPRARLVAGSTIPVRCPCPDLAAAPRTEAGALAAAARMRAAVVASVAAAGPDRLIGRPAAAGRAGGLGAGARRPHRHASRPPHRRHPHPVQDRRRCGRGELLGRPGPPAVSPPAATRCGLPGFRVAGPLAEALRSDPTPPFSAAARFGRPGSACGRAGRADGAPVVRSAMHDGAVVAGPGVLRPGRPSAACRAWGRGDAPLPGRPREPGPASGDAGALPPAGRAAAGAPPDGAPPSSAATGWPGALPRAGRAPAPGR